MDNRTFYRIVIVLILIAITVTYIAAVDTDPEPIEIAPVQSVEPTPAPTFTAAPTPTPEASSVVLYFPISDEDRDIVERVVTAEAIGEPYEGQKAVAQCILNTAQIREITPAEAATEPGQYATPAKPEEVTESIKRAVAAVFDEGKIVVDAPIQYFYAPARCESAWHESLQFVIEIGGHRFFMVEEETL